MARLIRKRHGSPAGAPPGTLLAHPDAAPSSLRVTQFGGESDPHEPELIDPQGLGTLRGQRPGLWVDVAGLGDVALIQAIGQTFALNELSLEDVLNVHQRPKVESFTDYLFVVLRTVTAEADTQQVSLFLGTDFVLSFQERGEDCFDHVRHRLRHGSGRLRAAQPDYLFYALLDEMIDDFFPVLEAHGERLEDLEAQMLADPEAQQMAGLHSIKRDLLGFRRAVWPAREMLNNLIREESPLIHPDTRIFLRDAYDHVIQLLDMLETYRELASSLLDIYLTCLSTRMNEVMKVLTIIATLFIPLSFMVGLWGMNFDPASSPWNMPELGWRYGYPLALLSMAAVAGGLLWFFRRKGWLGGARRDR